MYDPSIGPIGATVYGSRNTFSRERILCAVTDSACSRFVLRQRSGPLRDSAEAIATLAPVFAMRKLLELWDTLTLCSATCSALVILFDAVLMKGLPIFSLHDPIRAKNVRSCGCL